MRVQRLVAVIVFVLSALVVAGCGGGSPTTPSAPPTDKQLQKEKMKSGPDGGSGGPGKK